MEKFYYKFFKKDNGYYLIQLADLKYKLDFDKNYFTSNQLYMFYKNFLKTYGLEREIGMKFKIYLMDEYFDFLYYNPQYIRH